MRTARRPWELGLVLLCAVGLAALFRAVFMEQPLWDLPLLLSVFLVTVLLARQHPPVSDADEGWGAAMAVAHAPPGRRGRGATGPPDARERVAALRRTSDLTGSVIASLAMAIDAKGCDRHSHVACVREYAVALAERLQLSLEELEAVKIAALLHDIGKLGVPEHILSKPGKLTSDEFEIIKSHVTIGTMILEPVRFPWPVVPIVLSHHERWDGNGYPNGLVGEEIPIGGRIVALADVFDALTSTRPYRTAMPREKAIEFIRGGSGTQFDPRVVEAFIELLPDVEERIRQIELPEEAGEGVEAPEGGARATISAEVLEQIARANEETFALCELTDLIAARPELGPTLELVAGKVSKLVSYSTLAIFLVDEARGELEPVYKDGLAVELLEGMTIKVGEGASGWVVEQNEAVLNGSASLDMARKLKPTDNLELSSTLSVPLMGEGKVIGALTLYHTGYNFYKPHHLRLVTLVAEHAGPALESARQFARTRQLALEDTLTGLPNARALMHFLRHQLSESERSEREFVILLADLDNFKQINDQFGHMEGDRVLEHVSRLLLRGLRQMDFVARYAGDEFVIVLPDAGIETAEEIIARVRASVEAAPPKEGQLPLGISIGQAIYPADGTEVRRLLGVADGRMYADKSQRKRQAAGATPEAGDAWLAPAAQLGAAAPLLEARSSRLNSP
jgi:diguanylate cyclase (GGDEF)-like protein/putative nucleotidyltransferase with HDIG domain